MFALSALLDDLVLEPQPETDPTTYELMLELVGLIEGAIPVLHRDPANHQALESLQGAADRLVEQVYRIETFQHSLPSASGEIAGTMRSGLRAYHRACIELAVCVEDLDPCHLDVARALLDQGEALLLHADGAIGELLETTPIDI